MSTLIILPWLKVGDNIQLDEFELDTISVGNPENIDIDPEIVRKAVEPFHLNKKLTISDFTYVSINDQILNEYSEDELNSFSFLHEILVLSGLASREFFSPYFYCNTDQFDYYIRNLKEENNFVTISGRRRDGSTQNFIFDEALSVIRPPHIPLKTVPIKLNQNIINSLIKATDELRSRDWNKIYNSIISFNKSNTDNAKVSQAQEIILMRSAFEQLLSEQNLANNFEDILNRYTELQNIGDNRDLLERESQQNTENDWSISKVWMKEFTLVRDVLAHGHDISNLNLRWPLREHLLLGSFIYPAILKSKLADHELYELTNFDLIPFQAFEELCSEYHLVNFGEYEFRSDFEFPWNKILNRYRFRAGWEKIVNS